MNPPGATGIYFKGGNAAGVANFATGCGWHNYCHSSAMATVLRLCLRMERGNTRPMTSSC